MMRWSVTIILWALLVTGLWADEKQPKGKPSPEAVKELRLAARLLEANQVEQGIARLQAIVKGYPGDPAAEEAKRLLLDNGVGEGVRVKLIDRKVFRNAFKIPEKQILALQDDILNSLREQYKDLKPYFEKTNLVMVLYESQARYRKDTGSITTSGHFRAAKQDRKARSLEGEIVWFFPRHANTLKDRQTEMSGLLYHENTHYLNAIYFCGLLPSVFNEGIAAFLQGRKNTEYYQYFRTTDRLRIEADARNGLHAIAKYEDFIRLLDSSRGFERGDEMIHRWYGLCYAIVDFLAEKEISSRRGSLGKLLKKLEEITHSRAGEIEKSKGREPAPFDSRKLLEDIVRDFYGVGLDRFYQELVKHILASYKQQ